jgi:hypothetical protein
MEFETLHTILLETDWVTRGALSTVYDSDVQKRGVSPCTDKKCDGRILLSTLWEVKRNAPLKGFISGRRGGTGYRTTMNLVLLVYVARRFDFFE